MSVRILAATGSVGLAPTDPARSFHPALERAPRAIVADAGSADVGPAFLGANRPYNEPAWEEHDLDHLVEGALRLGVPLVVGSCGVHGTDAGVESYAAMVDRIARRLGRTVDAALLFSEQTREWLHSALDRVGSIEAAAPLPALTHETIDRTGRLVAVMGVQPILTALRQGSQIVLCGRAADDALFAAVALLHRLPPAPSFLAGKLLENASLVAEPFTIREAVLADVDDEGVTLEPVLAGQRCTRASVAAQLMYERRTPLEQAGPGGVLELDQVRIEELDARRTRVTGARYRPAPPTVKVEGAGPTGYRAVCLVGCRDPGLIAQLDPVLDRVHEQVRALEARCAIHVFGRNGVMGPLEPTPRPAHEVAIVVEIVAGTQGEASRACLLAKRLLFSASYPGQKATGGSVMAMIDEVWEAGPAYRWTVHHLVPVLDPAEPFRMERRTLGAPQ